MKRALLLVCVLVIIAAPLMAQKTQGELNITFGGWNTVMPPDPNDLLHPGFFLQLSGVTWGMDKHYGPVRNQLHQFVNLLDGSIHDGTATMYFFDDPVTPSKIRITYSGGGTDPLTSPGNVAVISGTWTVECATGQFAGLTAQGTWKGVATLGMLDFSGIWPVLAAGEMPPGVATVTFTGQLVPGGATCPQ